MRRHLPRQARGHADHGWLDTNHTFSFANWYDPDYMGFRALRVINEDRVAPGAGFGTHPHRDMEIISYVLGGGLEHRDSMGNGSIIRPGEVQRMSAGTGVTHSEYNASKTEPVHFLQIWIVPDTKGLEPSYEQKAFAEAETKDTLRLVASRDGREGSVTVHQDIALYAGHLEAGTSVDHVPTRPHAFVFVARGRVRADDLELEAGSSLAISQEPHFTLQAVEDAEILVFDLA